MKRPENAGKAYVEVLGLNAGQSVSDAIDTYLYLHSQGLTVGWTSVDVNGQQYPIGYFDEETIELFKLAVITLNNISYLVDRGYEELGDEVKTHTNYFVDQLFEKYTYPREIPSILRDFDEIIKSNGHKFLDAEQWTSVKVRLEAIERAKERETKKNSK